MPPKEIEGTMAQENDFVALYASTLGFSIGCRTVLVEGTTDVGLFHLAARLELEKTGIDLLNDGLAFVAPGERDLGGTHGVIRELVALRGMARTCLLPNGRPRYRFIGLFDNDKAGNLAVKMARSIDSSILEYKDVFRLRPVMPLTGNLDPGTMQKTFERENYAYKGLEWELEDLITQDFIEAFLANNPQALARNNTINGKTHRDLTPDGKAKLHRFIKMHAIRDDLSEVIHVLKAIRFYLGISL